MINPSPSELAEFGITEPSPNGQRPKTDELLRKASELLPQSPDAEKGLLSSLLNAPVETGGLCVHKNVGKDHFFIPAHAIMFEVLMALWGSNQRIDFIILTQLLRDQGRLEQCGGAAYVTELFTFLPTAANAAYYIEILEEKLQARRVEIITSEYKSRLKSEQDQLPSLLDDFERDVMAIRKISPGATQRKAKALVLEAITTIETMYERRGQVTGLSTGFSSLDIMLDGLHADEMIVLAARPGRGKSSLAMQLAEHIAVELMKPVGIFSLEMSDHQLMLRSICSRARVNLRCIQQGFMSERDFPAIQTAGAKLAESEMFIDDQPSLTINDIKGRARRWKAEHDIQAVFIDYLQLIRSMSKRAQDNRTVEVSETSAACKALAKELGIPVVVLVQVNRSIDARGPGARPRLSDLRDSGSIEADADVVMFLTQPWMDTENEEDRKSIMGHAELFIGKNRNGPSQVSVPLMFLSEYCRFESRYTEDAPEPQPYRPQPVEQSLL